jgi:hypothetical protein
MKNAPLVEPVAELPTSRRTDWSEVATQVAALDGGWALLAGDFDPSQATHLRNGRVNGYDPDVFEVSSRRIPLDETGGRRRVRLYMRKRT